MGLSTEDIQNLELNQLSAWVGISARALWWYDYLQTLPMEIHTIWAKPTNTISILFLVNRYMLLTSIICETYVSSPGSGSFFTCSIMQHLQYACGVLTVVTTSALFTMRVYAVNDKKKWILVVASFLVLARIGCDLWTITSQDITIAEESSGLRCNVELTANPLTFDELDYTVQLATDSLAMAFDTFIFALTVRKTYSHVRQMQHFGRNGVAEVLLRDGILYFMLVFAITVVDMTIHIITVVNGNVTYSAFAFTTILSSYYDYAPNMLINRLVLNLHDYSRPLRSGLFTENRTLPDISFAVPIESRVLGNIGAPLDYAQWDDAFGWSGSERSSEDSGSHGYESESAVPPTAANGGASGSIELVPPLNEEADGWTVSRAVALV